MIWRIFIVGALLAVAILSVYTRRQPIADLPGTSTREPEKPPQPGYFMTDARILQTNADGSPLYRVTATRIQQNPSNQTIRLENLHLDYYSEQTTAQPNSWILTAKTGVMPQDATKIQLQEGVEIRGRPQLGANGSNKGPNASQQATIRTSKLFIDLQAHVARTREPVDIEWGPRRLSAIGLSADLKTQRIKLESSVRGRFVH